MSAADLKRRWREGATSYSVTARFGLPFVVEMLAESGFDIVKFDLENGLNTVDGLMAAFQAMKGTPATPFVKVPSIDGPLIGRLLDIGAEGIVAPVETAEDAARVVAAFGHHPDGNRSNLPLRTKYLPGGSGRELACFAQIETERGLRNIEAILSMPGIDGAQIGLVDIAHSLGIEGRSSAILPGKHEDAVRRIVAACKARGLPCGTQGDVKELKALGFQVIGLGSDISFFEAGMNAALARRP
jgi:4-hydroxy-2-oxoheptanedioate aldolase